MDTHLHVHMISDSTGETLNIVMRAACAQFDGVVPVGHNYFLVRSEERMATIVEQVSSYPGIVFYTILKPALRAQLESACARMGFPALSIIDPAVSVIGSYLGRESDQRIAGQHVLNENYFRRMEAIHFALTHDDGQGSDTRHEADVVIIGVSRTSKTPTCVYLGNRGVKAANIPLVPGISSPFDEDVRGTGGRPLIVGLKISPNRLVQIRMQRLLAIGEEDRVEYADHAVVREEIHAANRLFSRHDWPIIDVTRRSVEETAAAILNLLNNP